MPEAKRLLVLAVDVDADLEEKAKIRGPVIGRKAVSEAATKMAIADPQEVDANTMFQAIKLYDDLSKEHTVEIATITGSRSLGYAADREIVKQLEKILNEFKPEACVFVSDGASDEQIIPLIQGRVKINSVHTVFVKQSKELEKTYFAVLDKLKEPHYARLVFGLPGFALVLYYLFGAGGLRTFVGLLGAYLVIKGVGIEDWLAKRSATTRISFDKISFIFYFAAMPLALVALGMGTSKFIDNWQYGFIKAAASFIKQQLLLLISILIVIVGQFLEAFYEKKPYLYPDYLITGAFAILFGVLLNTAADWIIGVISFADFFTTLALVVVAMFLTVYLAKEFKKDIISRLRLEGKEVYTELGSLLGTIVGINKKKDTFLIETESGARIDLDFNNISSLGEKVIIRY